MSKATLLQGDCLELMNRIPDSSIDMVLSDLPYGTTRCRWDTPINLQELWKRYRRVVKENVQANAREKVKGKIFTDAMEAAADTLGILKDHKINTTVQLLEMFEHYETLKKMESQTLDNINDPLEPLKISSALKSELLKLQFRKAEKPENISPLDYTVIAALKEALEKRV